MLSPKSAFMASLVKAVLLNFLGLSFPLCCLGELASFIDVIQFPSTLVFGDFYSVHLQMPGRGQSSGKMPPQSLPCLPARQCVQQ